MSGSVDKSSGGKSFLSVQTIVLSGVGWSVAALLFFLLFSATSPGPDGKPLPHPLWYSLGTSVFELVAFLSASILCFRNWKSPQIVSGRNVWLAISLGMLFYFIGGILFTYWETGLGQEADVSPGDFFYILTYVCLLLGMVQAVFSRRLNLEIWQWGVVAGIAAIGIALAVVVSTPSSPAQALLVPPAAAQTAPATPKPAPTKAAKPAPAKASPKPSPVAKPSPSPAATAPSPSPTEQKSPEPAAPAESKPSAPAWAIDLENALKPLAGPINLFYVVCDVVLLISATTLLLAFWGGRFAQSWRMIAAAAFSLYIADMWYKYAIRSPDYQSGSLPEVFWVFSGVLFGIGAALEYDLSLRSRRGGGRRRGT